MDIYRFKEMVSNSVNEKMRAIIEENNKYEKTIHFLYIEIIKELGVELQEKLISYNKILEENYKDIQMYLFYDSYYHNKYEHSSGNQLIILIDRKNMKNPSWGTLLTNFDHFVIKFENVRGEEKNYAFSSNYFFSLSHANWLKDSKVLGINENNKENIINEIRSLFSQFLDLYISRSQKIKECKLN